jgi:uncharacterized YccA/Bax inhibitor family protein
VDRGHLAVYEEVFDGIVGIALIGTTAIAFGVLILFSVGKYRVTPRDVPRSAEWYAAFGIVSSIVWIYLEVLRLLARLAARNQ